MAKSTKLLSLDRQVIVKFYHLQSLIPDRQIAGTICKQKNDRSIDLNPFLNGRILLSRKIRCPQMNFSINIYLYVNEHGYR